MQAPLPEPLRLLVFRGETAFSPEVSTMSRASLSLPKGTLLLPAAPSFPLVFLLGLLCMLAGLSGVHAPAAGSAMSHRQSQARHGFARLPLSFEARRSDT